MAYKAVMANETQGCRRCNGEAMPQFRHVAGGKCFECGRTLTGTASPSASPARADRATSIARLSAFLANAARAKAEGDLAGWVADATNPEFGSPWLAALHYAPADVRARAEAALARLVG